MYRISTIARARELPVISRLWKFSCRSDHIVISLRTPEARTERPLERRVFVRTFLSSRSTSKHVACSRAETRANGSSAQELVAVQFGNGEPSHRASLHLHAPSMVIVENSPSIKVLHAGLLSLERKTRERSDPRSLSQIPLHFLRILSPYLVLSPTDTRTHTYTYRETREKCAGALTTRARRPFVCRDRCTVHITGLRSHVYTFRKVSLILV